MDSSCRRAGGWKRGNNKVLAKTAAVKGMTAGKEAVVTVTSRCSRNGSSVIFTGR
jgi:hypothetical protein